MQRPKYKRPLVPLDQAKLEAIALHYVSRYATTRKRLSDYLARKIRERGWDEDRPPDIAVLADHFAARGYIDDSGFATMRQQSLLRKGFGERRIRMALDQAGVLDHQPTLCDSDAYAAADAFARRKRIGPYAVTPQDPKSLQRQFLAMLRAGHSYEITKKFINSSPDEFPEFFD